MKLLYVLNGKNGITSFTYKELELLEEKGISFILLFTKLNSGNLNPKNSWEKLTFKYSAFLIFFILQLIPLLLSKSFYTSFIRKEISYYLLARYFKFNLSYSSSFKVHVQMGDHKLIIGYYLKKLLPCSALSTTIHAHELYSGMRYKNESRFKFLLKSCSKIFTISNFNRNLLINELNIPSEKIELMYLYPSFEKLDLKKKVKILMTGNWERKKGYEDVFSAIEQLNRNDFVVLIAGKNVNPKDDLNLIEIIKNKKLESKVLLLGHVNKNVLAFLYSFCDLFLLPSKTDFFKNGFVKEREGIPVALIEAMNYGLPVISTDHAGIPELVKDFIIEEGNINELIDRINFILDNVDKIKLVSLENIEVVSRKFNFNNINVLYSYIVNG